MEIRLAENSDLPRVMELYTAARAFMRRQGNTVQWTGGYPSVESVAASIAAGEQWVVMTSPEMPPSDIPTANSLPQVPIGLSTADKSGNATATFWFAVAPEPTYEHIFDGPGWLDGGASFSDSPYGVVHRLASDGSVSGVGAFCLEWCLARCGNIRVDTHSSNSVMQRLLARLGYTRCGVIVIADGTPRDAFQKIL